MSTNMYMIKVWKRQERTPPKEMTGSTQEILNKKGDYSQILMEIMT